MTETLRVLIVLEAAGLAALPLTMVALGRMAGTWAVAFAKPVGFIALGWLVHAGGRAGIPNETPLVAGSLVALAVGGLALWPLARRRPGLDRGRWLRLEALTAGAFVLCALFNAYEPAVWGTEKPMDMAILSTTIASPAYPPEDLWLAGSELNYYYVGHVAAGALVRLAGVDPVVGYNLALAALFAMVVVATFGLAAAIAGDRRPRRAGAAAVVLLAVAGTVHGGAKALGHDGPAADFDWFGASRVIPGTINEFPFFSFLLGDLHAHVIVLPVTLAALAAVIQTALHGPPRGVVRRPVEATLTALLIGIPYAISSWTLAVTGGMFLVACALWARGTGQWSRAAVHALTVTVLAALLVLPFALEFDPPSGGLGWVERRQELADFLADNGALYGSLLWGLVALYVMRLRAARHPERIVVWGTAVALFAIFLLAEVDLAGAGIVAGLLAVAGGALLSRQTVGADRAVWLLVAGGLACILAPELVYVRDEFDDTELFRMNTVFKLGHQAWVLLAIAAGVAVAVLPGRAPRWATAGWLAGLAILVALGGVYTLVGSYARKEAFAGAPSLDGKAWLARSAPGDPAAIDWIRANVPRGAVVLEAVGEDYSAFGHARISTYAGRPTVLGWPGHELQYGNDVGDRAAEVRSIYTSVRVEAVRARLRRHRVQYVVVGPLERTDYGDARTVIGLGRLVFEQDGTAVYRMPDVPAAPPPAPRDVPPLLQSSRPAPGGRLIPAGRRGTRASHPSGSTARDG